MAAILFEHPLDELTSNFLRVETLFSRVDVLINRFFAIDHHFCLLCLFEIADLDDQFDLSAQILAQLNAQKAKLNGFRGNPKVSVTVLTELLAQVEQHTVALLSQKKKLAHMIADDEWLYKLREAWDCLAEPARLMRLDILLGNTAAAKIEGKTC